MECLQLVHKTINLTLTHAEFRNRKWDTLCTALWQHNLFLLSFLLDRLCMSHWLLSSYKCRCRVMPHRKKKCPSCEQHIYIKSTPDNRTKRIMTEAQATDAEEQWHLYNLRQKSLSSLFPFGLTERDIE